MYKKIANFFHAFKNKIIEAEDISEKYRKEIKSFSENIKNEKLDKSI